MNAKQTSPTILALLVASLGVVLLGVAIVGCAPGHVGHVEGGTAGVGPAPSTCDNVTCGGHGTCSIVGDSARCTCEPGYTLQTPVTCASGPLSTPSSCANVTCSDHGQCVAVDGAATCLCDSGYTAKGTTCVSSCAQSTQKPQAVEIEIAEIRVNQAISVPVAQNGADSSSSSYPVPIIQNRRGLVRVFVRTLGGFVPREINGLLTFNGTEYETKTMISSSSQMGDLLSTLNFDVPASGFAANPRYSVVLREVSACPAPTGTPSANVRYPQSGTSQITTTQGSTSGSDFAVKLVPINYKGSYTPTLDQRVSDKFKSAVASMMPTNNNFQIIVANYSVVHNGDVRPDGGGWGELLSTCQDARRGDSNKTDNTYFYCPISAGPNFGSYCPGGCVAGVGNVAFTESLPSLRVSTGIQFNDVDGDGVFAHELGHTLGRPHAPCGGAAGAEPAFPYRDGSIGKWGYHADQQKLFDPSGTKDWMSYCGPTWISDYAYKKVFERFNNSGAFSIIGTPFNAPAWRKIIIEDLHPGEAPKLIWSTEIEAGTPIEGDTVEVQFLDQLGEVIETVHAPMLAITHVDSYLVYIPKPTDFTPASVAIGTFGVTEY